MRRFKLKLKTTTHQPEERALLTIRSLILIALVALCPLANPQLGAATCSKKSGFHSVDRPLLFCFLLCNESEEEEWVERER